MRLTLQWANFPSPVKFGQPRQLGKEFEKVSHCHWNRPLATTAWVIFVVSLFLPAVGDINGGLFSMGGFFPMRGYACAIAIFPWNLDYSWEGTGNFFGLIHGNLMNLANLLMVVSPILLRQFGKNARSMKWLSRVTLAASASVGLYFLEIILSDGHGRGFKIGF